MTTQDLKAGGRLKGAPQGYTARSAFFDAVFVVFTLTTAALISIRCVVFKGKHLQGDLVDYSHRISWLLRKVLHITVHVRGRENIPADRPVILASRHMSWLDPIISLQYANGVRGLAKKELFAVPFLGAVFRQMGNIRVDRAAQKSEIDLNRIADEIRSDMRPLMIYPEGTRCPPGQTRPLKTGVYRIHEAADIDVCPIRTNSGFYWRGIGNASAPGTIVYEVLPPLPRYDDKDAFMSALSAAIAGEASGAM